jgi:hypothetical protein
MEAGFFLSLKCGCQEAFHECVNQAKHHAYNARAARNEFHGASENSTRFLFNQQNEDKEHLFFSISKAIEFFFVT